MKKIFFYSFIITCLLLMIFNCTTIRAGLDGNKPTQSDERQTPNTADEATTPITGEVVPNTNATNVGDNAVSSHQSPSSVIDPNNFDADLLASLIHDKINVLRASKTKCKKMRRDNLLDLAAQEQSRYVMEKGTLSHEQPNNKSKYSVLDRVKYHGGWFTPVGENLLYQGFKHRVYDNGTEEVIYITYDEMAIQMVKGWQKSKPHYSNIIECDFTDSGVAVTYSYKKNGIFAAQVFGGK